MKDGMVYGDSRFIWFWPSITKFIWLTKNNALSLLGGFPGFSYRQTRNLFRILPFCKKKWNDKKSSVFERPGDAWVKKNGKTGRKKETRMNTSLVSTSKQHPHFFELFFSFISPCLLPCCYSSIACFRNDDESFSYLCSSYELVSSVILLVCCDLFPFYCRR